MILNILFEICIKNIMLIIVYITKFYNKLFIPFYQICIEIWQFERYIVILHNMVFI